MKNYTTTITVDIHAETDECALRLSKRIAEDIKRNHNPNTELDSVVEHRLHGFNNRHLDLNQIKPRISFTSFLFKLLAR